MNDPISRLTPQKPVHIHEEYPQHDWELDEDGEIDMFALDFDFHNGPRCRRCHHSFCMHCYPDWADLKCIIDRDRCPTCGASVFNWNKYCSKCGQALDWGT